MSETTNPLDGDNQDRLAGRPSNSSLVLAYEAAKDVLKGQDATLGNTRTRASGVLTVAALVTTFSAGVGLMSTDPAKGAVLPAEAGWALLGLLVLMGALVMYVLWPIRLWHFGPNPHAILEKSAAGQDDDAVRGSITETMIKGIASNRDALKRRQSAFRASVALLLGEVCVLVSALLVVK